MQTNKYRVFQAGLFPLSSIAGILSQYDWGKPGIEKGLENIIYSNGDDGFFTFGVYSLCRAIRIPSFIAGPFLLGFCIMNELGQRSDTNPKSVYDEKDLVAYVVGIALAYIVDKGIEKLSKEK